MESLFDLHFTDSTLPPREYLLIKPNNYALFHYWNQKSNKTPWYSSVELIEKENFLNGTINFENYLNL